MTDQLIPGPHAARSTLGGNPFPPIADYGFLSDCEVSALVAPSGNVPPSGLDPATGAAPAVPGEKPTARSGTVGP
jgi:hypothetical protein